MAGLYTPIVTVSATPFVEFTTGDLTTYEEIQKSQGSVQYKVESMYIKSISIDQINQPIKFQRYGSNGDICSISEVNLTDPAQFQPAKNVNLKQTDIIFDGNLRMEVLVLAGETIDIFFGVTKADNSMFLKDNRSYDDGFLKTYGFFQQYSNEIKEDVDAIKTDLNNGETKFN